MPAGLLTDYSEFQRAVEVITPESRMPIVVANVMTNGELYLRFRGPLPM
jgi:hypothetical protein